MRLVSLMFWGWISLGLVAPVAAAANAEKIHLIGRPGDAAATQVTIQDVEKLGLVSFLVFNPDERAEQTYTGVWLKDFVAHYATPDTGKVIMTAIDRYQIAFERADWERHRVLLATRVNGKTLDFATKGPMRVVYVDYDPKTKQYQESLPKWIWMITKVEFKD